MEAQQQFISQCSSSLSLRRFFFNITCSLSRGYSEKLIINLKAFNNAISIAPITLVSGVLLKDSFFCASLQFGLWFPRFSDKSILSPNSLLTTSEIIVVL